MLTQLTGVMLNAPPVGRVLQGGIKTGSVLVLMECQKKKCCFVKENYFVKKRGRECGKGRDGGRVLNVQC